MAWNSLFESKFGDAFVGSSQEDDHGFTCDDYVQAGYTCGEMVDLYGQDCTCTCGGGGR